MDTVALQLRLHLERECSALGRYIAHALEGTEVLLMLGTYGDAGDAAWFTTAGDVAEARTAARRWLRTGVAAVRVRSVAEAAELQARARGLVRGLEAVIPAGTGFLLLLWEADVNTAYLSSIDRDDARRLVEGWLAQPAPGPGGGSPS
jgi:hypothetical protein